jgi:two-component system, OmpR family, sensor histidine kinase MprB
VTLRLRLTLVAAGVVALVVALASTTTYFVMRHELQSQLDRSLHNEATALQFDPGSIVQGDTDVGGYLVQEVDASGDIYPNASSPAWLPPLTFDAAVRAVATGARPAFYRSIVAPIQKANGEFTQVPARELVAPLKGLGAVLVVRSMVDMNHSLGQLRLILIIVSLGGVAVAAAGGALVSGTTLAPVRRLTAAAERITETGEPSERVPEGGRGELARLGHSFNRMLGALEESLERQRRFVADASHELRTPLTSLQTNLDVLRGGIELDAEQQRQILDDLHRESQEMRSLIAGLLELARSEGVQPDKEPFQLDELVQEAVERARMYFPAVTWETARIEPTVVDGYRERMERAVWNLLENAAKWSGADSSVEVALEGGELCVRDHGPGFEEEDQPLVFERFYRSAAARAMPGSGLGLSIVREVAEAHGGTVAAENAPDGGALVRLSLDGRRARLGTVAKS